MVERPTNFPSVKNWNRRDTTEFLFPKYDGHQVIVERSETGHLTARTKTPIDITNSIRNTLEAVYRGMPNGTVYAGELWLPGHDCSAIKTAMKEQNPNLRWWAFAILSWPATAKCTDVETHFCTRGIPHVPFQRCHENAEDLLARMIEAEATFDDYEGYILKDNNYGTMWKWKPTWTIDVIVKSVKDGKGKFFGQVGALVCETEEGYPIVSVSGMDDETRLDVSIDSPIGRVIEVKYQSVGTRGRLRHPRFVRFRDDKKPSDCSAWQEERLINYWHGAAGQDELKANS